MGVVSPRYYRGSISQCPGRGRRDALIDTLPQASAAATTAAEAAAAVLVADGSGHRGIV